MTGIFEKIRPGSTPPMRNKTAVTPKGTQIRSTAKRDSSLAAVVSSTNSRKLNIKKTIKNNESKIKTAGITRITEITHLDRIGIPVFSAIRPTAQDGGIIIYGGKGNTPDHAKASAMMEGFERYSAEKQDTDETVIAGLNEIEGKYIDPISLNLPKDFSKDLLDTMNL